MAERIEFYPLSRKKNGKDGPVLENRVENQNVELS